MFEKLNSFTKDVSDLADQPSLTPAELKAQFDAAPDEVRQYLNKLIDALTKTTSGDSGAKNIGATTISGLTGSDVQTILESLKTYSDGKFAQKTTPSFTAPTLQNGFVSTGLSMGAPQFWKNDSGTVFIEGACDPPASPLNKTIFTLPVGSRPGRTLVFNLGSVLITVFTSGDVQFGSSSGRVQFGCISFPAEN